MPTFPNTLTKDGDAYLISSPKDLCDLSEYVEAGNDCEDVTFKLAADIDLSDIRDFTPIGKCSSYIQGTFFNGTFDGDGHTISNLTINRSADYQGLFGYIRYGTVKNVKLEKADIKGGDNVGGIAGRNDGTIIDCLFSGKVASSRWTAGGIAGFNVGTIEHCTSIFNGEAKTANVGGIAGAGRGNFHGTIRDCYAVIKRISSQKNLGGIIGKNPKPCYAHGWYYSDNQFLDGVGAYGKGDDYTERLYKISLLKASGVKENLNPHFADGGKLYYKDGSTLTLDGALAAGDEIEIRGFSSVPALSGNTANIGRLTITLNLSLPADEFFW